MLRRLHVRLSEEGLPQTYCKTKYNEEEPPSWKTPPSWPKRNQNFAYHNGQKVTELNLQVIKAISMEKKWRGGGESLLLLERKA